MVFSFDERVNAARERSGSDILLLLRPLMSDMPAPMHFQDDPFFPFSKDIIAATREVICGYIFDFPAYMVHAGAGARALERSIAYAGPDVVKILHGPFVGDGYISMVYEDAFGADAATLADASDLAVFLGNANHGAFVVSGAEPYPTDQPTYWSQSGVITLADRAMLRVAGTDVLYSDYTYDYAKQCRAALEAMQNG